ncbi:unnamed protein product [Onchocerca flexuosa]|uniref:FAD synthase n=1 Tax=Onchocerca flexuosa TaxID=387005 RepID=A0A183I1M9_9BILA|nr:unnamed protein product [Onchocerca flexuosa]
MMWCRIKRLIMDDSLSYLIDNRCYYSGQRRTDSECSSDTLSIQRKTAGIIMSDNINDIAYEVKEFSEHYDVVFSSGGIGPTHDDRTYTGLANAFHDELTTREEMRELIEHFMRSMNKIMPDGGLQRMCTIPKSARLLWSKRTVFPLVQMRNVYAFPGIPEYCTEAFKEYEKSIFPSHAAKPFYSSILHVKTTELQFSDVMMEVAKKYDSKKVSIGSYPIRNNQYYKTKLLIESECAVIGEKVVQDLKASLKDQVIYFDEQPWINAVQKFNDFRERELASGLDDGFVARLDDAMKCIDKIISLNELDEIAISFNGGKDCTLVLHLLRTAIDKLQPSMNGRKFGSYIAQNYRINLDYNYYTNKGTGMNYRKYGPGQTILGFHIVCGDSFPEVNQFIIDTTKRYNIVVLETSGPVKAGLVQLNDMRPKLKCIFMGSRATDPSVSSMKSKICPILDWSYDDVWRALRGICIPYCPLYDLGYTSLGGRDTTRKNDALKIIGDDGSVVGYKPAYMLKTGTLERTGRS